MALPAISLAVGQIAVYMRLLRSDMIATLQEDFITMAKSKGISPPPRAVAPRSAPVEPDAADGRRAQRRHAHRRRGRSIEVIFSLPGIGHCCCSRPSTTRQYVALQSLVAIIAVGYVLVNFLVDILYSVLDPRIRHARRVTRSATRRRGPELDSPTPTLEPVDRGRRRRRGAASRCRARPGGAGSGVGRACWPSPGWSSSSLAALLAPVLPLDDPNESIASIAGQGPGTAGHILGGDGLGRDMLSRVIWGARASLLLGVASVAARAAASAGCSAWSPATSGAAPTRCSTGLFDVLLSFPQLILALTLVTVFASRRGHQPARGGWSC